MTITSWTIIRLLTGNCDEDLYKAFLQDAKTVSHEIIDHQHRDISRWLSKPLCHKFGRIYNEFQPRTAWHNAEHLRCHGFRGYAYHTPSKFLCIVLFKNKSRFEATVKLDADGIPALLLRATQGHSGPKQAFNIELSHMEKIGEDSLGRRTLVHGTSIRNWGSIGRQGLAPENHLKPNGRNAVHFLSLGMRTRVTNLHPRLSSLREPADLFIELDIAQWIEEGKTTNLAPNGVICVFEAIPLPSSSRASRVGTTIRSSIRASSMSI